MKKHPRTVCLALALVLLAACLPGCANEAPPTPPTPQEAAEETSQPSPEPESTPDVNEEPRKYTPEQVGFEAEDGLEITADLYKTENENAPYIVLFHMSESSRGEYAQIAPKLCKMGYNCLAVDQRSGRSVGGVKNLTASMAIEQGLTISSHVDALPDMRAALLYVKEELRAEKIILWGSSYSASLIFTLDAEYPDDIAAILAFSPVAGDAVFPYPEVDIVADAAKVNCPVFITVEAGYLSEAAAEIYENVPSDNKVYFRPDDDKGRHGSPVLDEDYTKNELYWEQVTAFLNSL